MQSADDAAPLLPLPHHGPHFLPITVILKINSHFQLHFSVAVVVLRLAILGTPYLTVHSSYCQTIVPPSSVYPQVLRT